MLQAAPALCTGQECLLQNAGMNNNGSQQQSKTKNDRLGGHFKSILFSGLLVVVDQFHIISGRLRHHTQGSLCWPVVTIILLCRESTGICSTA